LRLLTWREEQVDRDWWRARLQSAIARRQGIEREADAFRLVYAEGDALPSLIIDRYADVLVLQTLSQGTDAIKEMLVELLAELLAPRAIIERNDVRVRALEGLPLRAGVIYGDAPEEMEVVQHGTRFLVAPLGGQKTGAFLDQRENHLAAQRVAHGRALDCFTFNGAFALHMAQTCESVLGLDISAEAVAASTRNAELNNLSNVQFPRRQRLRCPARNAGRGRTLRHHRPRPAGLRQKSPERARRRARLQRDKLTRPQIAQPQWYARHLHVLLSHERNDVSGGHRRSRRGRAPPLADRRAAHSGARSSRPRRRPETLYLKCVIARAVD
jgi:hypothetical protein